MRLDHEFAAYLDDDTPVIVKVYDYSPPRAPRYFPWPGDPEEDSEFEMTVFRQGTDITLELTQEQIDILADLVDDQMESEELNLRNGL